MDHWTHAHTHRQWRSGKRRWAGNCALKKIDGCLSLKVPAFTLGLGQFSCGMWNCICISAGVNLFRLLRHPIEEVALEVGGEQFTIWQGDGASGLLACGGAG